MEKALKPKRRLVRGRDFDGWAFRLRKNGKFLGFTFRTNRPGLDFDDGQYVRVRFVEVEK
jgi:hypothetical protein